MEKTTIAATMAVLVAILMVGSVLVPIIEIQSTETITITNDGAGWARYDYVDDSTDYDVDMSVAESTLTLGTQSGTASEMIVWASDVGSVICSGSDFVLLYDDSGTDVYVDLGASAGVASASGTVTVIDSTDAAAATLTPAWAYVPAAAGQFGFVTETGKTVKDFPVVAAGSELGFVAYGSSSNGGALDYTSTVSDGVFEGAEWSAPEHSGAATYNAGTTSYTDGDWTFQVIDDSTANVVSYSGTVGESVVVEVPSTVSDGTNTYTVVSIGSIDGQSIFGNSKSVSTVLIPDTVTALGTSCLRQTTFFDTLVLPSSISFLGFYAFSGTSFYHSLIIPSSVEIIKNDCFNGAAFKEPSAQTQVEGNLVIAGNPTMSSGALSFNSTKAINVLYLGDENLTDYGLTATTTYTEIPLMGYIAPVSFSETAEKTGAEYDLMRIIPIMVIAGILMASAVMFGLMRRND